MLVQQGLEVFPEESLACPLLAVFRKALAVNFGAVLQQVPDMRVVAHNRNCLEHRLGLLPKEMES